MPCPLSLPHRPCRVLHDFAWHGDICECVSYIIAGRAANSLAGSQKVSQEPGNRLFCIARRHCDSFSPSLERSVARCCVGLCISTVTMAATTVMPSPLQSDGRLLSRFRAHPQLHLWSIHDQDQGGDFSGDRRDGVK